MKTFKFGLSAILAIAIVCASTHSFATVLSSWTFETFTPSDLSNSAIGPPVSNEGGLLLPGFVQGFHASANTDWTTPAGNGSANSYSANEWAVGDYFQIDSSSLGYTDLTLTFDATGSGTGPRDFEVQASTDGTNFSSIGFSYAVLLNGGAPNASWSSGGPVQPAYTISTSLPASLSNQAAIFLRLVDTSTTSTNGGTVGTGGTSRIDNVLVEGNLIPEPSSLALMFASMCAMMLRRR